MRALFLSLILLAQPAMAEPVDRFTRSNLLYTLYHEMGHALVDLLDLPLMGLEEDAADAFAVHLIDRLHPEMEAREMVRDVAYLYGFEHTERVDGLPDWTFYSTDARRGFNTLCQFYGGDPDGRAGFARKIDLPTDRRDACVDERERQRRAWDGVLTKVPGPGKTVALRARRDPIEPLLKDALARINATLTLPRPVHVRVAPCDEPNAYWETGPDTILICAELRAYIDARAPR